MVPNSEVIPADGYNFKKMERGGGRGGGSTGQAFERVLSGCILQLTLCFDR